jgi:hypothetical protein
MTCSMEPGLPTLLSERPDEIPCQLLVLELSWFELKTFGRESASRSLELDGPVRNSPSSLETMYLVAVKRKGVRHPHHQLGSVSLVPS